MVNTLPNFTRIKQVSGKPADTSGVTTDESSTDATGNDHQIDGPDSSVTDSNAFTNPADISAADSGAGSDTTKRRGRPRGSRNGVRKSDSKTTRATANIEGLLLSLHLMGAAFTKIEEIAITPEEATALAGAINRVTELYEMDVIPEKTLAWIQLGSVAATVYGPRVVAYNINRKKRPVLVKPNTSAVNGALNPMGDIFNAPYIPQ